MVADMRGPGKHNESSVLTFSSPCGGPEGSEEGHAAPQPSVAPTGVLVVDDDAGVRAMLQMGLGMHGLSVWLAAGGPEALDLFRAEGQRIALVLLDVRMPGMDGPQTLAGLRQINPAVPVWFMTGDSGRYSDHDLRDLGIDRIVPKPFSVGEIARQIREVLEEGTPRQG
jgi:CheY-like chemotaxis protein